MDIKKIGMLVCFALQTVSVFSQSVSEHLVSLSEYNIRNYGVDEGINGIQVQDLYQDREGFLWVVSTTELLKFDGSKFFAYQNENAGGTFYEITPYDNNEYLLSQFGTGIQIFQGDSITTLFEEPLQSVKTIIVKDKKIYAGTYGDGIYVISNDSVQQHINVENGLISNEVWTLYDDSKGRIWVGTNSGVSVISDQEIENYSSESGLPDFPIRGITEVSNGQIWVGTNGGGISVFEQGEIVDKITNKNGLINNFVYTISENPNDSSIWIGHRGEGGVTSVKLSGETEYYSVIDGLISDMINDIFFMKDGEVAIATEKGLALMVPKKIEMISVNGEDIYDDEVVLVKQDSSGKVWIGSYSNGYKVADTKGWNSFESPPVKTNGYTQSSTVAENGDIWFGTQGAGIIQVRNNQIIKQLKVDNGLSDDYVRGLQFDEEKNLWVCTNNGIDKLDKQYKVLRSFKDDVLPNPFCTTITKDNKGNIWAGTFGGGVVRFKNDTISVFNKDQGLKSDQVISVYADKKSQIWVGTLGNGLAKISDNTLISFDLTSGIPEVNYAGFKEDKKGNFWMATGNGIVRTKTSYFEEYENNQLSLIPYQLFVKDDGMLTDNMQTANNSTIELLKNGDLLFATTSGVVKINPEKADFSNTTFFPYIAEVTKDGEEITLQNEPEFDSQSKIEISFSSLNYAAPHKTEFRIKLGGIDEDWVHVNERSSAYYDYLPDGKYTFFVSAKGPGGQWGGQVATYNFSILPPFYKTWWFFSISGILFTCLIVGVMQIRSNVKVRKLNREIEYQQKLHQEKERISRDLHDNVGSQITNLITGIEISNMHIEKGQQEEAGTLLKNLDEDARNTMTDLRETIWLLDKEKVQFSDFENHLKSYIRRQQRYFGELQVLVKSKIDEDFILDPSQSLNLMRIIQEAVNNTRKYAEATNVIISFDFSGAELVVTVSDDGKGMDVNEASNLGNGLNNMRTRAAQMEAGLEINSFQEKGTEIRLSFQIETQ